MNWTKEQPKIPGYYWCKIAGSMKPPWIVRVVSTAGGLVIEDWRGGRLWQFTALGNSSQTYEWYGPLKPPGGGKTI